MLADLPISALKGVGVKLAAALQQFHIDSVQDLLFHLPLRYEDRTRVTPIAKLSLGSRALFQGTVRSAQVQMGKRRSLLCRLSDATGSVWLRFFYFTAQQQQQFSAAGMELRCFGEVRRAYGGQLEVVHPEYRQIDKDAFALLSDRLTAVYPTTAGLHQSTWRKLMQQALCIAQESGQMAALLPQQQHSVYEDLCYLHNPPADADTEQLLQGKHPVQQRLIVEELVAHQLALAQSRYQAKHQQAVPLLTDNTLQQRFLSLLPFELTAAQQRVWQEIQADLSQPRPMLRLVQGDVGSGKTVVAALALLQALAQGKQAALMAPTELLAEQHWQNLQRWLLPLGVRLAFLARGLTGKARQIEQDKIRQHDCDIIVGTHALFQEGIVFADLAVLVIDEQHRFGVGQRLALKEKGVSGHCQPHQLMMTATPIPRTLTMTNYADLDVSVIDELPPGRQPIRTVLASNQRRDEIIARVKENCHQGRQAYWVCTLIDDSEVLRAQAAQEVAKHLSQSLPELSIGLVHGRLQAAEKEQIMAAFKAGTIHLLVATTVIEVGVDVPNASLMIIENAERLGLAQLHQLRGRVGRGSQQSFCVLLYQSPLSLTAKKRLQVMRDHQDGFYIAEQDWQIRGPGEVLGTRQTGLLRLKIADLLRDQAFLPEAKCLSQRIVAEYPDRIAPLLQRWLKGRQQYAQV